jgi:hypothetical protein
MGIAGLMLFALQTNKEAQEENQDYLYSLRRQDLNKLVE